MRNNVAEMRNVLRKCTFQVSMKMLLLVFVRRAYLRRYSKYESLPPPQPYEMCSATAWMSKRAVLTT